MQSRLTTLIILLVAGACLGVAAPAVTQAQPLNPLWDQRFGDDLTQRVNGVAVDDMGRTVIAGFFAGTINFGCGLHVSAGDYDIFVAKFAADGSCLWSRAFGSTGNQIAMDVDFDNQGSVYISGYFENTVNFGGSTLVSGGGPDAFLVKLDPYNATHYWSSGYGGSGTQVASAVIADDHGKVYATGYFQESVDFGGGPLVSAGSFDVFLVQLDRGNGVHMWSHCFGDSRPQLGWGIDEHDVGMVAIVGDAEGTIDFGGGPLTSAGQTDVFVAKFNSFGYHEWSALHGDASYQEGIDIAFHGYYQDVVITGRFQGTVNLGGATLVSAGDYDIFLAEYNTNGAHLWSRRCGGTLWDSPGSVHVGSIGQIVLAGYFEGAADFGGGNLISAGGRDVFLATYDTHGAHQLSERFGDGDRQVGVDVEHDPSDDILLTGNFRGAINFGNGPLVSAGDDDVFLVKFGIGGSGVGDLVDGAGAILRVVPNPCGTSAAIRYALPEAGWVRLSVHDAEGRCLQTLFDGFAPAGLHDLPWRSGTAERGVRYLRLDAGGQRRVGKILRVE